MPMMETRARLGLHGVEFPAADLEANLQALVHTVPLAPRTRRGRGRAPASDSKHGSDSGWISRFFI